MNIFAVLDLSDNEEEVKKPSVKKSKDAGKESKPAPAKTTESKTTKTQDKSPKPQQDKPKGDNAKNVKNVQGDAPAADGDDFAGKENNKREKTRRYDDKRTGSYHEGKNKNPKKVGNERNTGVSRRPAKDGSGAYGAGNVEEEALKAQKNPDGAIEDATPVVEGEEQEVVAPIVEEPVDTTLSFDEFLRKRTEARNANDLFAPAKATRVVDPSSLAGLKAFAELEDIYIAPKNTKTVQAVKKDQRSAGKTQVIDVAFKFESAAPEYRRRDDNRGERRPRTAGRGEKKTPAATLNSGDFPSL